MNIGGLDPALVRRLIRRVGAYVQEDSVSEDALEQVFDMFGADELHREAVMRAIEATGVNVQPRTRPHDHVERNGSEFPRASTGKGTPSARTRVTSTAIPASDEVEDARALLEEDRWNSRPWKRILTAREEIGLAMLMRGGEVPLRENLPQGFRKTLSNSDERARAFDALMLHNSGLVWMVVKQFTGHGVEAEDLAQSGYEGLRRGVEKFDATAGWKFSTYAMNWIKQAMSRAVANTGRLIRLPVHMYERVNKVLAVRERLLVENGKAALFDIAAGSGVRPDQALEALLLASGVVSLDAQIREYGATTVGDLLEDERYAIADPLADLISKTTSDEILEAVESLTEKEAAVIRLRFGFDNDEPMTLDAIGAIFGVTRERIRQIEKKAKQTLALTLHNRGLGPRSPSEHEAATQSS